MGVGIQACTMEHQKTGVTNQEFMMDKGKLYVKTTTQETNESSGGNKKIGNDNDRSNKIKREVEKGQEREHFRGASSRQLSYSNDPCEAVTYCFCGLLSCLKNLGSCCDCDC